MCLFGRVSLNRENVKRSVFSFILSLGQIVTYFPRFPGVVSLLSGVIHCKAIGFDWVLSQRDFVEIFGVLALNSMSYSLYRRLLTRL